MSSTSVVCGVKDCRYYGLSGCKKKAIILSQEGKCLSKDETTQQEVAAAAGEEAAEGALQYAT